MNNITTALLEFLLDLLTDPQARAEFAADPEAAMQNAGLQGVTPADVDAVLPVAFDFSPVAVGNRDYITGGNTTSGGDDSLSVGIRGEGKHGADGGDHGEHGNVIEKLFSVVKNYHYIDDRDVINDQSVNQNIWADGDVHLDQKFENESNTYGDGNVVEHTDIDHDTDIEDSYNDNSKHENSHNDNSEHVKDSYNDNSINDDHSTTEDSYNDESTNVDIELDVDVKDSFNDNKDSFNDNFKHGLVDEPEVEEPLAEEVPADDVAV